MSNVNLKELIDEEYFSLFEQSVRDVKSGTVSVLDIEKLLRQREKRIDEWSEDSDMFEKEKALELLQLSESILQTLPDYETEVRWELLGAVLYFVNEHDGIHDSKVLGLDDDDQVMRAVLKKHNLNFI